MIDAIAAAADPTKAEGMKAYHKTGLECWGAPMPNIRQVVGDAVREDPTLRTNPWPAVAQMWNEVFDCRLAATVLLERARLDSQDLPHLERLLRDSGAWALVDPLAIHALAATKPPLARWAVDDDKWVRRAALLCHLKDLGKGKAAPDDWAPLALPNLDHADFFIRKALGWALRTIGDANPAWTADFVREHQDRMAGLTIREATRKLPSAVWP